MNASLFYSYTSLPSGIMGLAFDTISVDGVPPVFQVMLDQGLLDAPQFAFFLETDPATNGELFIGGYDPAHIAPGQSEWGRYNGDLVLRASVSSPVASFIHPPPAAHHHPTTLRAAFTELTWVNLTSETYWEVDMAGFSVGGRPATTTRRAVLDTGTSLLAGPSGDVKAIMVREGGLDAGRYIACP